MNSRRAFLRTGLVSTLMLSSRSSLGQQANEKWAIPGGVAQIRLSKDSDQQPIVKFGLNEPVILEFTDHWRVVIGLDLTTLPGDYVVYVKMVGDEAPAYPVKFSVRQHRYAVKSISTTLDDKARTTSKLSELDFSNTVPPALPLLLPVNHAWRNDFGLLWVSEDGSQKMTQQNFISLDSQTSRATAVQVVQAPQNGIVSRIIGPLNSQQSASSIYIDHGRGLYSILHGLEDLTVETGNGVVAGAVLGKIKLFDNDTTAGQAPTDSLVTNSNALHWQCVLNGVYVNPLILTEIS